MSIMTKEHFRKLIVPFAAFAFFLFGLFFLSPFSSADTYTVTYKYDASSRLIGVEYSTGTTIEYNYDAAGNMVSKKVFLRTECEACSGSPVVLTNVTFTSGTVCECSDDASITIQTGVTIESGANIIFKAPTVKILSGFQAKEGAVVKIQQQ